MASDKRQEIEDLSFLFPYLYQLFFSFCFASFSTLFILQAAKFVAQVKRKQREKISLRELFKKGQKKRCSRGAYLRPSADFLREKDDCSLSNQIPAIPPWETPRSLFENPRERPNKSYKFPCNVP